MRAEVIAVIGIVLFGAGFWLLAYKCKLYPFYAEKISYVFDPEVFSVTVQVVREKVAGYTKTSHTLMFNPGTKTLMPMAQTTYVPDRYLVKFISPEVKFDTLDNFKLFESLKDVTEAKVSYRVGKLVGGETQKVVRSDKHPKVTVESKFADNYLKYDALVVETLNGKRYFLK